jgi:hypothetical protein
MCIKQKFIKKEELVYRKETERAGCTTKRERKKKKSEEVFKKRKASSKVYELRYLILCMRGQRLTVADLSHVTKKLPATTVHHVTLTTPTSSSSSAAI